MSQINISNLTFAYDGASENVFENVSFSIDTDWKLGFTGRNGRGKTTFMKLLMKKYEYSGSISSSVNFEYFPYDIQDTSMLTIYIIDENGVIEKVMPKVKPDTNAAEILEYLGN